MPVTNLAVAVPGFSPASVAVDRNLAGLELKHITKQPDNGYRWLIGIVPPASRPNPHR
jgi:hypothetical protein